MDRNLTAFSVFFLIVGVVLIAVSILCLRIAMEVEVGTTHLTVSALQFGAFGVLSLLSAYGIRKKRRYGFVFGLIVCLYFVFSFLMGFISLVIFTTLSGAFLLDWIIESRELAMIMVFELATMAIMVFVTVKLFKMRREFGS
jgi:hypothetical protein